MSVKVGDQVVNHYSKTFGLKASDKPPIDIIAVNDEIVFNKSGWDVNFFDTFCEIAGFKCIGWNDKNGHHTYKCDKPVEILECPELIIPQYWKKEMFV